MSTMKVKMAKNASRVDNFCWDTVWPFTLTGSMALGWRMRRNSLRNTLNTMTSRMHLKPPVVDPEQAPMNIRQPRTIQVMRGHMAASSLKMPVVVMNDTTWKSEDRKARSSPYPLRVISR